MKQMNKLGLALAMSAALAFTAGCVTSENTHVGTYKAKAAKNGCKGRTNGCKARTNGCKGKMKHKHSHKAKNNCSGRR